MAWAVFAYLWGMALGSSARFGWWLRSQPQGRWLKDYWQQQRGEVILSLCLGFAICGLWCEGTLMKATIDHFSLDWPQTNNLTTFAAAVIDFFAPQGLRLFSKRAGLDLGDTPAKG